jgi:hypothetical protein
VNGHRDVLALATEIGQPRHADLARLVVGLEHDRERTSQLLLRLADAGLFADALAGAVGPLAEQATRKAARRSLQQATKRLAATTIMIHPEYKILVSGGHKLSASDRALLAAVGTRLHHGEFVEEVIALLDATDATCRRSADAQARTEKRRPTPSAVVAAVLVGLGSERSEIAAWHVLESCRISGWNFQPETAEPPTNLIELIYTNSTASTYGRLLLLCYLLQRTSRRDMAAYALAALRLCWESGAYHLQLDGLETVQSFAAATEGQAIRQQIVSLLEGLTTDNIFLSSQLVDTMYSYDIIELQTDDSFVRTQIADILQSGFSPESGMLAYGIVSSQFEDIVAPPYFTAIEGLKGEQRVALFTIASLGAPPYGFWNDWLLKQLIKSGSRTALPAYEHWTTSLNTDTAFIQQVATCYFLAIQGCAQFLDTPPMLADRPTPNEEAWELYGAIVFWLSHPSAGQAAAAHCAPLWQKLHADLLPAAADPLRWIAQPGLLTFLGPDEEPLIGKLLRTFPDEIRTILEWGLENQASLTSIFGHRMLGSELAEKILYLLGSVGNTGTVDVLRSYVDDKDLGRDAIRSMRAIQGR